LFNVWCVQVGLLSPPQLLTSNYQQKMSFEEIMAKGTAGDLFFRNNSSPYAGDGGPLQATGSRIKAWHRGDPETSSPSQQSQQVTTGSCTTSKVDVHRFLAFVLKIWTQGERVKNRLVKLPSC
jgi:hypothetical protein